MPTCVRRLSHIHVSLHLAVQEEKEEWRRFQADLQTAVVVANDIKVEAQQELRSLRRQLQEEQERSGKLSADLEALQGVRYRAPPSFLFLLFLPLSNPPLLLAAVPRVSLHSAGVRMWSVLNLLVSQEEKTVTRVSQLSLGFFVLFIYYLFIF